MENFSPPFQWSDQDSSFTRPRRSFDVVAWRFSGNIQSQRAGTGAGALRNRPTSLSQSCSRQKSASA